MRFSLIITAYNAQSTLAACLEAVFSSDIKDFEAILIDDGSSDKTAEIVKGFPCRVISLGKNSGTAFSRNTGKDNAKGAILVFIDADVVIKKDTLKVIGESFRQGGDIVAVTGLLTRDCPGSNFFSQYKNLYMHYIFRRCPRFVDFLYGSAIAVRRDGFLPFNTEFKFTDDTELGQRYKRLNKKILLNQDLEVTHLKVYDLKGILKNDFSVPFWWAKSFILHKGYRDIFLKRRFSHARAGQLTAIFSAYLLLFSLFIAWQRMNVMRLGLLIIFLALNYGFFKFLYKEKGAFFLLNSLVFTFFDSLVLGLGAVAGFCHFLAKGRK